MLVIFLQVDKESKSKNNLFFFFFFWGGGGWGGWVRAGGGEHNDVQMFQMTLPVFKEYNYAKLF